ncbi:MAG: hypothetical protein QM520_06005, partial [Gammaproteobacteria bacterium]|nr:hypothetical protein [Gammaproteobacteria bacterium]
MIYFHFIFWILCLLIWQSLYKIFGWHPLIFPSPLEFLEVFYTILFVNQKIWEHIQYTLLEVLLGWGLGSFLGWVLGI